MNKTSILNKESLESFRQENKLQPFRIKQINQEIFQNSNVKFDEMTSLSKDLRNKLNENFEILSIKADKIVEWEESTKISFETKDWKVLESVLMYHWHTKENWEKKLNRITLCVSSQVWCAVGCIFCVTWKLWFMANLSWEDIISQLIFANNYVKEKFWKKEDWTYHKVRNIVFMWMWEPLLNYENVKKSIQVMLWQWYWFSLSKRHITVSTSWIIPGIKKMLEDNIECMLAISLHAANQELREKLVPIWSKYKLDELIDVLDEYYKKTWNRLFHEYIMIKDMNDKPEHAKQLAKLLKHQNCHINLIPYNENPAMPELQESEHKTIKEFKNIAEKNWLTVTIRQNMWRDEKWACWQLGWEKVSKAKTTD